jgi:16S rRNA (adenine(1408)-N(1))-methyltransferase
MERILGKTTQPLAVAEVTQRLPGYRRCLFDIGTGDGRFVLVTAAAQPQTFVIGLDACRENLRLAARRAPDNALFLIANALALPADLQGLATQITVNFPWGSLLTGLLSGDGLLPATLAAVAQPGAQITVRLNGGALTTAGWSLEAGVQQISGRLRQAGFAVKVPKPLSTYDLQGLPTTWARRIRFGRDPRAVSVDGVKPVAANL